MGCALINLEYLSPPPDVAEFISAFYLFSSDDGVMDDLERADIAQYRLIISGEATMYLPDGTEIPYVSPCVLGPRTVATRVVASGQPMKLFGCGILPAGWASVMKRPAHECVNRILPAPELLAGQYEDVTPRLISAQSLQEMADAVVGRTRELLTISRNEPLWLIRAINEWLESSLSPDIAALEESTGLSRRQLERQTKHFYGAAPKLLVRKYRALRAANAIAQGTDDWLSYMDGTFYDQSHFIREIKQFTGLTPNAIRDARSPLSAATFGRHKLSGEVGSLTSDT
jgi:AraC-like DNA-binding protein